MEIDFSDFVSVCFRQKLAVCHKVYDPSQVKSDSDSIHNLKARMVAW